MPEEKKDLPVSDAEFFKTFEELLINLKVADISEKDENDTYDVISRALHIICKSGDIRKLNFLLKNAIDVIPKITLNLSELGCARRSDLLKVALANDNEHLVVGLLDGISSEDRENIAGVLSEEVRSEKKVEYMSLCSSLVLATKLEKIPVIEMLLDAGVDSSFTDYVYESKSGVEVSSKYIGLMFGRDFFERVYEGGAASTPSLSPSPSQSLSQLKTPLPEKLTQE